MLAPVDGLDAGCVVREIFSTLTGRRVDLELLTESRCAHHIASTLITAREKILILYIHLLREYYQKSEITKIS